MTNPADCTITVKHGCFEGEDCFEATIRELPDIAEYGDTALEAYQLALDTIETTAEIFAEPNRAMPLPMPSVSDYSGRITLRISKTLHRELVIAAAEDAVSLNQHIVDTLSFKAGRGHRV
jgi:predicted RNase H-like HicB family nuclease